MPSNRALALGLGLAIAATALPARDASAQHGAKAPAGSACASKGFPLVVGNSWTFTPGTAPTEAPEGMVRFIPIQPKKVVITVKSSEPKDGMTLVTLDEDFDGRKLETTISCDATHFDVSPDGFFFAGEPGGYVGLVLDKVDRKLVDGTPWAATWREDLAATWKRVPADGVTTDKPDQLGTGKLEIERRFTFGGAQFVNAPFIGGSARQLQIELTGRIWQDGVEKPMEMPANWKNSVWYEDGVGPVQVLNSYHHMYVLSDAKVAGLKVKPHAAPPPTPTPPSEAPAPAPTAPAPAAPAPAAPAPAAPAPAAPAPAAPAPAPTK